MASFVIQTKNLHKTYGKKKDKYDALRGINLDIKEGESVAIIGKSGSGKSTLMHLLALLDTPTEGAVLVDGQDVAKMKKKDINKLRNKEFGFVFQQFFMNARDSVLNNVMLPLKIAGVPYGKRKELTMEALETVELKDRMKNKANDLSGGQKQRVCIARALVNEPSVIFADEPTGNLDSVTGAKIEDLLMKLNKEKGITLIVVTHDKDLAKRCDRQVHIKDGKIEDDSRKKKVTKK